MYLIKNNLTLAVTIYVKSLDLWPSYLDIVHDVSSEEFVWGVNPLLESRLHGQNLGVAVLGGRENALFKWLLFSWRFQASTAPNMDELPLPKVFGGQEHSILFTNEIITSNFNISCGIHDN